MQTGLEEYLSKHASALALTKGAESFAAYRERLGIDTDGDYYRGMQRAMLKAVKSDPGYGNVAERLYSEGLADSGYALHLGVKAKEERERTERELAEKRTKAESEAVGGYLTYLESYAKASARTMNDLRSRLIADGVVDTAISYEMAISSGLSHEAAEAVSRDVYAAGRERIMKDILNMVVTYELGVREAGLLAREWGLTVEDALSVTDSAAQLLDEPYVPDKDYISRLEATTR